MSDEWVEYRPGRYRLGKASAPRHEKRVLNRGAEPDFSKGPIRLYTEPMKGHGPVDAPHYDMNGMVPVVRNMRELREYEARNQHAGRMIRWDKG